MKNAELVQLVEKKGKRAGVIAPISCRSKKSAGRTQAKNSNESSMLAAKFCIVPMMD
jgi:hypothetical protein